MGNTPKFPSSLRDRYEPDGLIGAGAMGAVWRVHDLRLDRKVALKQLRQVDEEQAERFRREARTLAALQHPHIVQVLDHGVADDQLYLVMELVEGRPFDRLGPDVDPLPGWMQVGEALQVVHENGIVHRDVKPANAVLDRHGRAVLLDFGLIHDPGRRTLTKTGHVVGSLAYLAPELLQGRSASPQADWYSWGVSLFQLLEGRLPFENEAILDILEGRPRPEPAWEHIGPDHPLRPALQILTQPDPRDRPVDWEHVRELLADPAEASLELVSTPTRSEVGPSPLLARGRGRTSVPRAPLALAAALGLGLFWWITGSPTSRPPPPSAPPPEDPATSSQDGAAPESLRLAYENMLAIFPAIWHRDIAPKKRAITREEVDAYMDGVTDARVPLAYQRFLDEMSAWLQELGAGGAHLGAVLRRPETARDALPYVQSGLILPLTQVRSPRGWYERQMQAPPGLGRRLIRLNEVDADLSTRLARFVLETEEHHQHLPPILVAAAILANPLPVLTASNRDPRPTILVMAQEVPEDTPFASLIATAAVRHLGHQQPKSAVNTTGAEGLALCAANMEAARHLSEVTKRFLPRLPLDTARTFLSEAAAVLEKCIRGCPPAFQDKVTNAHLEVALRLQELLDSHPAEKWPATARRRDDLARAFHEIRVWNANVLRPPAAPRR
jgi:serine/threonine-protein kinase